MSAAEDLRPPQQRDEQTPATAAKNIIAMLQQAADVAKRNEDRAKAQAAHWYGQYHAQQTRIERLEEALELALERASHAEEWIERIHASVKESLLDPLMARSANGKPQ